MGEFEEKLNSILSDPAGMEKILGLARELSGAPSGGQDRNDRPDGRPGGRSREKSDDTPDAGPGGDILSALSNLDPRALGAIGRIMSQYGSVKDDKRALVTSMKPYVRPERREALDRALKVAHLAKLARIAMSELGGGDIDIGL